MNKSGMNAKNNFGAMGWLLIVYIALSFFLTSLLSSCLNIAADIFAGTRGWSQPYLVSLVTVGGWIGVAAVYIAGLFIASGKLKLRPLIIVCVLVCGAAVIIWGFTSSIAVYTVMFIIYQICYVLWCQLANQTIASNYFPRKKGLVMGWATFGFPLGAGPGIGIFVALMGGVGIANTFMIIGIAVMVVGIAGVLIFPEYPEQRGHFPDNDRSMTHEQAQAELKKGLEMSRKSPWTTKRMLTTREVWFISLSCGMMLMFASGSILQVVPRLAAIGYTPEAATSMLTVTALIAVPGSYLCGLLDQKAGTKTALIVTNILGGVACIMYCIPGSATIWAGLIMIGIALGGSSNYVMSATVNYWGRYNFHKAFGTVLGINQLVGQSGAALIAILASAWSYSVAYGVLAGLCFIGALLMIPVKDDFTKKYEELFALEDAAKA